MESGVRTTWFVAALAGVIAMAACEDGERPPAMRSASTIGGIGSARSAPPGIDARRAIAAAITAVPGPAQEARLETHGWKRQYEVTVIPKGGGAPVRVDVDATSGKVLKAVPKTGRDDDD